MKEFFNRLYHESEPLHHKNTQVHRNYYIDNLKFILMVFVVVGHFALKLTYITPIKYLLYFIYIFHMPCFIFVSGFLAKRMNAGGSLRVDRMISILWLYFFFKIVNAMIYYGFYGKLNFDFFKDSSAPWYLLALSIWYLMIPFMERIKPKYLIPGAFLFGLIVGYISYIRNIFALSRVFVFLPFFIIGFCLTEENLNKFLRKGSRLVAAIFLLSLLLMLQLFGKNFMAISDIIYGGTPYSVALGKLAPYGILIRAIWYLLAFLSSAAIILLVPRCKLFFTSFGSRTMQVYMTHIWCRNILVYVGFFKLVKQSPSWIALLVLIGSVGLTFLLSNRFLKRLFDLLSAKNFIKKMIRTDLVPQQELQRYKKII